MISVLLAASYIYERYLSEHGCEVDEMKLHKLLYFAQREAFVQKDEPMFAEPFQAWKYGPVMVCIRDVYKNKRFLEPSSYVEELTAYTLVFDVVFENYSGLDSWSLSDLTQSEISWKNARGGYAQDELCSTPLALDDIRADAQNIKMQRYFYSVIVPRLHENYA